VIQLQEHCSKDALDMTYKKKLIEVALPLARINAEASREKSIRHGHPSTLHLWWARRPLAAARAVLWSSLVDDPSAHPDKFPTDEDQALERRRLFDILERLVPWEASTDEKVLAEARAEIAKSCDGELPKILDPFGGGGSIPLESLRLGLPTFSGDLNPVAVLIQRAMLEIPHRFADLPPIHPDLIGSRSMWNGVEGLSADVQAYGKWMQEEAKRRIGKYYPDAILADGRKLTPIAWIWARTVKSPDPSWPAHVPLVRSWDLTRKSDKSSKWIDAIIDHEKKSIRYEIRNGGVVPAGLVGRQGGVCLATGAHISLDYIREEGRAGRHGVALMAVVCEGKGGRIFASPTDSDSFEIHHQKLEFGPLPKNLRDFKTPNYGMSNWEDLFTDRQALALSTFSEILKDVYSRIEIDSVNLPTDTTRLRDGGVGRTAYADAIVTYLAFAVDKCSDYWSSICTWHSSVGAMRNTFGRQAIPMTWDFAEANPFSTSTGNWMAMVNWTATSLAKLPTNNFGKTVQRDARARIEEVGKCVITTDPPYYDNIGYADLSDFFYVWLRRNVSEIWPDECATLLTPKVEELIADAYRAGSKAAANKHFELGMEGVFTKAAENCDERYPATIFYAFKASESEDRGNVSTGWETFLSGLLKAGFAVTATWPIRTELANKIGVNAGDNMLASSIVLACRKRSSTAAMATRGDFIVALRKEMAPAIKILQVENIAPVDMAQSAIGPGISLFSRYSKVIEADGQPMTVRTALSLINEVLAEVLSGEESEFDADTRFAVTWYEQFGHNPGAFGDADTLAKAKNTTVTGVIESEIALSKEGKLRLLERKELSDSWDPTKDSRLTVWETTQHLIRALELSETDASMLLKQIGSGYGEKARQLAYLLYGICDRKKWAAEGSAYNMLVTAWPQLEKLAQHNGNADGSTDSLF
jgi:putative DNA methylase